MAALYSDHLRQVPLYCMQYLMHTLPSSRYFGLVREARKWFDQFTVIAEVDIDEFNQMDDTADPGRLVKRFRVS